MDDDFFVILNSVASMIVIICSVLVISVTCEHFEGIEGFENDGCYVEKFYNNDKSFYIIGYHKSGRFYRDCYF